MQREISAVQEARRALDAVDLEAFSAAMGQCLEAAASESFFLHLCIRARQIGWSEAARTFLSQYIDRHVDASADIYYQLGFETRLTGDHAAAANFLALAVNRPKASPKIAIEYAHMLYAAGRFEAADEVLRHTQASEGAAPSCRVMREFGKYFQKFPLEATESALLALKSSSMWRSSAQVEATILAAIAGRGSFSMLRLGDGEGAFVTLGEEDEANYSHLYRTNRHNRMAMWFGPEFPWESNGFFEETMRLEEAIADADVVAIPDLPWIRNAYKISSHVGIPSLSNVIRLSSIKQGGSFTSASIAKELHLRGAYKRILAAARRATLLTCLADLPLVVKDHFNLDAVDLIAIPGEEGSRLALGENVHFGGHYPDVYNHLCAELRRPWNGEVVLVAAGILGKLYTRLIGRNGGVAIDIGSLADMWLGKKTRPGDDPRFVLR